MRERLKKKNNIIIGSLLGVVFLMAVGYAAFATNLNIGTTSNITSTWNILITNISSTETGTATDTTVNKTPNSLTADISAELEKPGDKVTYQITVANNGNLDAKLESLTMTNSSNDAILITKKGIEQGSVLEANDTAILTVVMEYNPEVTSQPSSTTASTTITFNYVQSSSEYNELYTIEYYSQSWATGETSQTSSHKVYEKQVHFNEQGINVTPEDINLQRLGYNFLMWTDEDEEIDVRNATTTYSDLVDGDTSVKTFKLYAYWGSKRYTLRYDTQGGTSITQSTATWTTKVLPSKSTSKSGEVFEGWYTEPNGQGTKIDSNTRWYNIVNYDDTVTSAAIYANWTPLEFTIVYDTDGGSAVADRTVGWNTTGLNSPTTTKNGYTFAGWYTQGGSPIGDSTRVSDIASSDANHQTFTFVAHWTQN